MDCHEILPNALALAQHKRKGCMDVSELLGTGPAKAKESEPGELQISLDSDTNEKSDGKVTCLDCGKKCHDFLALHDHKKGNCPKTFGDITMASKLSKPIHCLNCHEASFKSYLELHKHKTNECPLTKLKSGPYECEHCTEQFDTMLKYSHHLSRCPIRQLLNVTDTSIESLTDTFTLAQDFGIDLNSIKQEMEETDEVTEGIEKNSREGSTQDDVEVQKSTSKQHDRGSSRSRGKNDEKSLKEDRSPKIDDELGEMKIKEEKIDDEEESENLPFNSSMIDNMDDYQCNFCGDEFSVAALYDEHMESCPLRNTMATKDITIPLSSDNSQDGMGISSTGRRTRRSAVKKQQDFLENLEDEDVIGEDTEEDFEESDEEIDEVKAKKSKSEKGKGKKSSQKADSAKQGTSLLKVKFNHKKKKIIEDGDDEEMDDDEEETGMEGEKVKFRIGQHDVGTATFAKAIKEGRKIFVLSKDQLVGNKSKSDGARHTLITCLDCGFAAKNKIQLENHKKSCIQVGSTRVFACFECSNSFYTRGELNEHKKVVHDDADYLEQTEKLLKQSMDSQQAPYKMEDEYECKHEYCYVCVTCTMRFPMKSDCQLHFIEKHPEELAENTLSFCKEQCKRCGMLVKCRHTAVYLCHVCREKFSTQIGCKMHFYESHPVELGKQKLPIFTCIEKCIKCHLEITVDVPDLAGHLGSGRTGKEASMSPTTVADMTSFPPKKTMASPSPKTRETPCENCLTMFPNVDAFLVHLPCSKTLNTGKSESIRINKSEIRPTKVKFIPESNVPEKKNVSKIQTVSQLSKSSETTIFQCSICQAKFKSKLALLSHKPCFGLQNDDGKYFCLACQVLFPNEFDYLKHKRTKHSMMGSPMTCWDCGESFKFYVDLSQHRLKHHGSGRKQVIPTDQLQENNISVVIVDKDKNIVEKVTTDNIREVIDHKIKVPGNFTEFVGKANLTNKVYKCDFCTALFLKQAELTAHKKIAHLGVTEGKTTSTAPISSDSMKKSTAKPVVPMTGTIKLPQGVQLQQGLVMKQGPDGKLCIQTPGVTDYNVSMVTAQDGSFQLKFDKTGVQRVGTISRAGGKIGAVQMNLPPGASILKPVQVRSPGADSQNIIRMPHQNLVKILPAPQKQGLQIRSVGQIVNLPDGKQVYLPDDKKAAGANTAQQKSRPNILSRANRRKSTPRKVMSAVDAQSQPINIEPQEDVRDDPDVDVVYSFRCVPIFNYTNSVQNLACLFT